jgi:hypothetical protein
MKAQKRTLVLLNSDLQELDRLDFPANYVEPPIDRETLKHLRRYIRSSRYTAPHNRCQAIVDAIDNQRYRVIIGERTYDGPGLAFLNTAIRDIPMQSADADMQQDALLGEIEQLSIRHKELLQQARELSKQAERVKTEQQDLTNKARQVLEQKIQATEAQLHQLQQSLSTLESYTTDLES